MHHTNAADLTFRAMQDIMLQLQSYQRMMLKKVQTILNTVLPR